MNSATVHLILNKCYAAFHADTAFHKGINLCRSIGGNLAIYDNYDIAQQNLGSFAGYNEAIGSAFSCQWIGLLKKVWTWPSLGMLI